MSPPPEPYSYSHLLGLYLGDGHVSRTTRTYQLRIVLDAQYPEIIAEAAVSMQLNLPGGRVHVRDRRECRACVVEAASKRWPALFPQCGPGPKHARTIRLAPWQRDVVDRFPEQFLRGLIQSDGCRCTNRFSARLAGGRVAEYAYTRYFFSNYSADIRGLFCEYCDRLGIRWTRSSERNVSVAARASVALLEEIAGPKT